MCWNFVCEGLENQYVEKHFKTHREIIHEILDHKYNELRDLVLHMYSSYITLVSAVSKDVKKDRKAHLCLRWVRSLNSFLDGSSENSNVCRSVFAELATKYSSSTIRVVTGILHSLVSILLKQKHTTLPNLKMLHTLLNLMMWHCTACPVQLFAR